MSSQPIKIKADYSFRSPVTLNLSTIAGETGDLNRRVLSPGWYSQQSNFTLPRSCKIGEIASCVRERLLAINPDAFNLVIQKIEAQKDGVTHFIQS